MLTLQKKHFTIFAILIVQFLLSVTGGIVAAFTPRENVIFPGVSINGVNVGGLSEKKAEEVLKQNFKQKMENGVIELYCNGKASKIAYSDFGIKYDLKATIAEVLKRQKGSAQGASLAMMRANVNRPDYPLVYTLNEEKLNGILQSVKNQNNHDVQNARIRLSGKDLKIIPGRNGLEVNLSQTEKKIRAAISKLDQSPIQLDVSQIKPDVTAEKLKSITDSLGMGITRISGHSQDNQTMIKSAVHAIDGQLISPGEAFSLNSAFGTSLRDRDYLAPQLTQTSGTLTLASDNAASLIASTLYQAVLYSELTVTERWRHLQMPSYVSSGQDAAVAFDKLDFKFINNGSNPVYVLAEVKGNYLIVNLLGVRKEGRTVQIIGKQGENTKYPGMLWTKVYRVIYQYGNEIKRELISDDVYLAKSREQSRG